LYAGFCALMLLLFVMFALSFNLVSDLNREQWEIVFVRHESRHLADELRTQLLAVSRMLRDPGFRLLNERERDERYSDLRRQVLVAMESLKLNDLERETRPLLVDIEVHFSDYMDHVGEVLAAIQTGDEARLAGVLAMESDSLDRLLQVIVSYASHLDGELAAAIGQTERGLRIVRLFVILVFFMIVATAGSTVVLIIRKVFDSLGSIVSVMNNLALGSEESIQRLQVKSKDELGVVAIAYNRLADTLERHIRYERSYQKEIEEQNWVKTTIAEISTMYQGVQDTKTLASRLLGKLAPLIGASYGAFYMTEDPVEGGQGNDGKGNGADGSDDATACVQEKVLVRMAVYAENGQAGTKDTFRFGEGLVGQCAVERQTIELKEPAEGYSIRTSLLEATPAEVIIMPVEYEGKVLAVIEFATLTAFSPLHRLLLQEVVSNVGITIRSVLGQMRVQKLLADSQALTEELQSRSKELQQQQNELLRINEELEEQYRSAELRSLELQSIKAELEEKARLLEQNSRYRTEFLANMSHELRTPLNSMLILTKILYDNEEGRLSDKQVEYAEAIYSSAQRLLDLINDILDLSTLESGKMNVQRETVSVDALLHFAERMFKPLADQKQLEFVIEKSGDVPETIESDSQRIMQVMSNLLSNAIKFTERGRISLRVTLACRNGRNENGDLLAIAVQDTGIGIPEDKQSIIFEAFQQADGTTSRKYGGTGLGLSISRNIAELLGGTVTVESREGEGSTFTLLLPLDHADKLPAKTSYPDMEAAAGLMKPSDEDIESMHGLADATVLVIDDEVRNVYALIALLEAHRLNVLYAENAQTGMAHLLQRPEIALVLMDVVVAGRNATDIIGEIHALPERAELPIAVMIDEESPTDPAFLREAGASEVLEKPVTREQALDVIRTWLARERE